MAKPTITREQAEEAIDGLEGLISRGVQSVYLDIAIAGLRQLLFAMDQKPALHRYRRKSVEPYGPYPWHYEAFVNFDRPLEGIEDEYFYAAPPVVTGFAVGSDPVAWTWHYREQWHVTNDERRAEFVAKDGDVAVLPLYRHAQPVPEYPEVLPCSVLLDPGLRFGKGIKTSTMLAALARRAVYESDMAALSPEERADFQTRIEEFKALIAQPAPVVPDGYVMVPMRLTAENGAKGALSGEFSETKFVNCPECFGDDECETCDGNGRIEITVPVTWTTIKEIWAKGVEHFSATPREVKGE
ncbi:hypothetical protein [Klebsiella variicola]|uniref:hypothetical protein n=1 Tax=Klebsiella variicola TaxID=244366 RepID=UPI0021E3FD7A|nr:hypothetical protein [Klebsiella variicola]